MPRSRHLMTGLAMLAAAVFGSSTSHAIAGQATVAVAANFAEPAKEIAAAFKAATGHDVALSFGSSGQFYSQIRQAAPFDVFLSADDERPRKLAEDGFAEPASRFSYAVGSLVLWTRRPNAKMGEQTLRDGEFDKLAIASPVAAPYGAAAVETLKALGVETALRPKIVEGTSIAQAYQFTETGNAEVGLVSMSQTIGKSGTGWLVPQWLYTPIRQDAVLLRHGAGNEAARAFLAFLKDRQSQAIIRRFGYQLEVEG